MAELPEDYALPAGFDAGEGRVRLLNETLPGSYSALAHTVNTIRRRRQRLDVNDMRSFTNKTDGIVTNLIANRSIVLSYIEEIQRAGGQAFAMPVQLQAALNEICGPA